MLARFPAFIGRNNLSSNMGGKVIPAEAEVFILNAKESFFFLLRHLRRRHQGLGWLS